MKTLIIGAGEVGKALKEIISSFHETFIRDKKDFKHKKIDVLHICYPDSDRFVAITKAYIKQYKPKLTIINSSVKIGTTRNIGYETVYSPIRGRHSANGLDYEMNFFPKFISSLSKVHAALACNYFASCGFQTTFVKDSDSLEFFKLISNVHLGLEIAWRQEVKRMMDKFFLDHRSYVEWEKTYSEGIQEH